ncbi:MAG: hypothetical protein V4689_20860 [Verrucomicrobiota bacterium]
MKTTIALMAALISWGGFSTASAKLIEIGDVPLEVAATINANISVEKLPDITINETGDGERYVVKLKVKGEDKLILRISADGDLIKSSRDVNLKSLPKNVRNAVEDYLGDFGLVVDIDKVTKGSQVSYVITVEGIDDSTSKIVLAQDGTIIQAEADIDLNDLTKKLRNKVNALIEEGEVLVSLSRNIDDGTVTYVLVVENEETSVQTTLTLDRNGVVIEEEAD